MNMMLPSLRNLSVAFAVALFSCGAAAEIPQIARDAHVVVLGEQHDNPAHHQRQAEWIEAIAPKALVFEMLTPDQAANANFAWVDQVELDAAINWSQNGWPSFDMYFPIFKAAQGAIIYGALVTREDLRTQLEKPGSEHPLSATFGLDRMADPRGARAGARGARLRAPRARGRGGGVGECLHCWLMPRPRCGCFRWRRAKIAQRLMAPSI